MLVIDVENDDIQWVKLFAGEKIHCRSQQRDASIHAGPLAGLLLYDPVTLTFDI